MDVFRAPENESLSSSSSGPGRWDPFRRPLDSIQPWHFRLLAALMLVVTSLSLAENLAVILCVSPVADAVSSYRHRCSLVSCSVGFRAVYRDLPPTGKCALEGKACSPRYSGAYTDHTYIIAFFITCFIVPLLVIVVSYGKLMQKLRKVSDTQGRLGTTRKPERQVARMVVVMIVAFLICWTPYAAFSILVTAYPSIELDPRLAAIPAFFSKTATVYNPIIYVFMNKQFRKCLIQMFSCSAVETVESNMNPTSERAMLTQDKRGSEMSTMAVHSTLSKRKTGDQHRNCQSFAQLSASENKICAL
ncbi:hypothetical protein AV530_008316 [Patagioenas fasciata monilis]|uniref:G-protein coupled receptors family 1 profile domain-containing protein n=1 Tax=Patagioenas fasciata monilis TaxID=372326 RepID=A0A1V4K795_PATFA|nr:hypothetical protein AV530_008316 [Patagioenas fasciata monilis]